MLNATQTGHGTVRFDYVKPSKAVEAPAADIVTVSAHAVSTGAPPPAVVQHQTVSQSEAAPVAAEDETATK